MTEPFTVTEPLPENTSKILWDRIVEFARSARSGGVRGPHSPLQRKVGPTVGQRKAGWRSRAKIR